MQTYTVVGLYPDTEWGQGMHEASFIHHVKAPTPTIAARFARRELAGENNADDLEVFAVFIGYLLDQYERSLDTPEYEAQIRAEDAASV